MHPWIVGIKDWSMWRGPVLQTVCLSSMQGNKHNIKVYTEMSNCSVRTKVLQVFFFKNLNSAKKKQLELLRASGIRLKNRSRWGEIFVKFFVKGCVPICACCPGYTGKKLRNTNKLCEKWHSLGVRGWFPHKQYVLQESFLSPKLKDVFSKLLACAFPSAQLTWADMARHSLERFPVSVLVSSSAMSAEQFGTFLV